MYILVCTVTKDTHIWKDLHNSSINESINCYRDKYLKLFNETDSNKVAKTCSSVRDLTF
jgi:hypothetical protein